MKDKEGLPQQLAEAMSELATTELVKMLKDVLPGVRGISQFKRMGIEPHPMMFEKYSMGRQFSREVFNKLLEAFDGVAKVLDEIDADMQAQKAATETGKGGVS